MPIYEYECKKCDKIIEELQGFNDPPLTRCKDCKGKLEKLISLSSFHLTGTGWYTTDYVKGAGVPPKAEAQNNPAIDNGDRSGSNDYSKSATVAESGTPSSPSETYKSIQKETKKARVTAKATS